MPGTGGIGPSSPYMEEPNSGPGRALSFHPTYAEAVPPSLQYAAIERERRLLVRSLPTDLDETVEIVDRYVDGSRLRLREVRCADGSTTPKLTHKAG